MRPTTHLVTAEARSLRIHPTAQRMLVPVRVAKFVKRLDLDAIGVLHAVEYAIGGASCLWVVDGHHRLAALMEAGMGEWPVQVLVHDSVKTDRRASDLFLKLNDRSQSRPHDTFRNELQAGYPTAVGIAAIVDRHGMRVEDSRADGCVRCVAAMKAAYERDPASLDAAIGTIVDSWGRVAAAFEGSIVEGLARFHAVYGDAVDRSALAVRLKKFPGGPLAMLGRAKGLSQMTGRPVVKCVAEVVTELYDKGRTTGKLGAS